MKKIYNKWDIQNNLSHTIDLRSIIENEKEKELIKWWYITDLTIIEKMMIKFPLITRIFLLLGASFLVFSILLAFHKTNAYEEVSIKDKIRLERLEICEKAYKKTNINNMFIYEQLPVVRCATYMTLVYAYESNFGKSNMCRTTRNCFGIKWNWYDTPKWFLTFKTEREWREYFAKKYFQWHYKKKINDFVNSWSETDQATYKQFMYNNYWSIYRETEYLYITN